MLQKSTMSKTAISQRASTKHFLKLLFGLHFHKIVLTCRNGKDWNKKVQFLEAASHYSKEETKISSTFMKNKEIYDNDYSAKWPNSGWLVL